MQSTMSQVEWKGKESSGNHSQVGFPFISAVTPPALADIDFIRASTAAAALRYAVQRSTKDDFEVADEISISHGYMSKVLKGVAGLHGGRLVAFMRATNSLAPLQWLAEQMGCDVVPRDSRAAEVAELTARIKELTRHN
jgi:hypothetical protein